MIVQKLSESTYSTKMIWGCAEVVVVALIYAYAANASVLLFIIPCIIMIGAMVWMMMGGMGRGTTGDRK
jgi:ascorbate-specific PTS system EIIC-type component UlaA